MFARSPLFSEHWLASKNGSLKLFALIRASSHRSRSRSIASRSKTRMLSPHFSRNSSRIFARIRSRIQTESSPRSHPDPFKALMQSQSFAEKMESCSRVQSFIAGISSATFAWSISLWFPNNCCKARRASVYLGSRRCCAMLDRTRGDK